MLDYNPNKVTLYYRNLTDNYNQFMFINPRKYSRAELVELFSKQVGFTPDMILYDGYDICTTDDYDENLGKWFPSEGGTWIGTFFIREPS